MATPIEMYYQKRGEILVKNLKARHFDAWYCNTKEEALAKALELIPEGSSVGWGGAMSAQQIGLMTALHAGNYNPIDRDLCNTPEEKAQAMKTAMFADFFLLLIIKTNLYFKRCCIGSISFFTFFNRIFDIVFTQFKVHKFKT